MRDAGTHPYAFADEVLVVCPGCAARPWGAAVDPWFRYDLNAGRRKVRTAFGSTRSSVANAPGVVMQCTLAGAG